MNVIEAVKTGLPFRRKNTTGWQSQHKNAFFELYPKDILEDDWVVKEEEITINKGLLKEVWYELFLDSKNATRDAMIQRLGFK